MTNISIKLTVMAAFGALSACAATSSDSIEALLDQTEAYQAIFDRNGDLAATTDLNVSRATGTARFVGAGVIATDVSPLGTTIRGASLLGDATVNVNFDGATSVSGSMTNFFGVANSTSPTASIDTYSGTITLSGGAVGVGNDVYTNYSGTLRGNGDTMVLNGTLDGLFLGNTNIRGIDMFAVDPIRVNGVNVTNSAVGLSAERR